MYFSVILTVIFHKEAVEKEWLKLGENLLDLIQQSKGLLTKLEG